MRRAGIAVAAAIVVVAAIALLGPRFRQGAAPPLPSPPPSGSQPAIVAEHLQEAFRAATANPSSGAGGYCLALHADMHLDDAQRCYELLEQRDPRAWTWRYYRTLILSERGGGDELVAALQQVTARAPEFSPAWWRLGEAEFKRGRYPAAAQAWTRAATLGEPDRGSEEPSHKTDVPVAAYAAFGLARIDAAEGRASGAIDKLVQATTIAPRFGAAWRLLAETSVTVGRQGDADRARAKAARLPAFAPYADPMVDTLARVSRSAAFLLRQASEADPDTAAQWSEFLLRRALAFDPGNPDVLAKLGRVLRRSGRKAEALDVFLAYHEKVPGDFEGTAQVGSSLTELGRLDEAERYLREALTGLDTAQTHYNLGVVLSGKNRGADAAAEYRRAIERDPYLVDARNNLAALLAREGRLAEATAELTAVLRIEPDNAVALQNLRIVGGKQ
jgi:tetratricopeptide (TPR) repeat protein